MSGPARYQRLHAQLERLQVARSGSDLSGTRGTSEEELLAADSVNDNPANASHPTKSKLTDERHSSGLVILELGVDNTSVLAG